MIRQNQGFKDEEGLKEWSLFEVSQKGTQPIENLKKKNSIVYSQNFTEMKLKTKIMKQKDMTLRKSGEFWNLVPNTTEGTEQDSLGRNLTSHTGHNDGS